ncbi:hypothetical protein JRQ81_006886 [Phrynocephalus forsythii]|uniref:UBZ4-type domain-containing protein n=1 Tax=Phrynocephalus forsythii TaxID=171643 RepID=A0A9Q0XDZ7_9SAUR|nr:hypothetical protein JRQ81_006886 [Phrynocephalus forsythii]
MADDEFPENKRPRKSASLAKTKRRASSRKQGALGAKEGLPSAPSASSIVSFFNNAPPPRIACPLCGQMVPRYGINRHLDEVCEKGRDYNGVTLNASSLDLGSPPAAEGRPGLSSPYFTQNTSTPERSPRRAAGGEKEIEARLKEKTSPDFKKGPGLVSSDGEPRIHVVKSIRLGSLSAKLSRRRHRGQGEVVLAQVWRDVQLKTLGTASRR